MGVNKLIKGIIILGTCTVVIAGKCSASKPDAGIDVQGYAVTASVFEEEMHVGTSTDSRPAVSAYIAPASIPAYSGSPYITINNNIPNFTDAEITATTFENYPVLDSLGRCGACTACVGKEIMPTEDREPIGAVKPTGWRQDKYPGIVDSDPPYLYNRCHLLGFQLTAENANERNLITGTRYMNVEGMLPFENMVADYVKSTGNHVMYRVTPVFVGNNLLASGVEMEARSVEDGGKGVCFHVYVYNVQPGIAIDYATGANTLVNDASVVRTDSHTQAAEQPSSATGQDSVAVPSEYSYVLNKNTHVFHYPYCKSVSDMKEKNKEYSSLSRDEIMGMGYKSCGSCHP